MATVLDLPPIFLLPTHLDPARLHDLEEKIPSLTYDIHEAEIILGNISKKERALFELRHRKLQTDPVEVADVARSQKRKWDATLSDSDSTVYTEDDDKTRAGLPGRPGTSSKKFHDAGIVRVVKLIWLTKSLGEGRVLPIHEYLIYQGRKKDVTESPATTKGKVARLPGCGTKIAELWHEWKDVGRLREADETRADPKLSVIQMFYEIWGVGDTTARDFYRKGWRELDDVVEYGWDSLSRVQQIGVKFYDEFKLKIPRTEVESIANTILKHARKFSPNYQMVIVGGYRRGKQDSGDVDVILSHPDASATLHFIEKLVVSLEKSGHVTHTLTLSNHNSERGQRPLGWKGNEARGTGFDTLDKALVVWQEPVGLHTPKSTIMPVTLQVPDEYGYVLLVAASTFFINTTHVLLTSKFRKASGLTYPVPYASNEAAEKDRKAYMFNCAQRAHANFTENQPSFLGALLISGLRFPVASAALGAGWSLSRVVYAFGYTSAAGPAGRVRGSIGSFLTDTALKFTAVYTAVAMIMDW
ncbi:DNA polymerase lambda [Colletotrichum karsti]|uniref:DNA polymerase n=1 Tax=Colletotrichum karsti TaxID=1095194 RepID=A0A9P6HTL6_9PEZI|nr:DNA polymerase lambda [Colletotrichum karsti]KAF9870848.1 DNA polymerase lambda [Colletotrichum karsti]